MCATRGASAAGAGRAEALTACTERAARVSRCGGIAVAVRAAGVSGTGAPEPGAAPERTPRAAPPALALQMLPAAVAHRNLQNPMQYDFATNLILILI